MSQQAKIPGVYVLCEPGSSPAVARYVGHSQDIRGRAQSHKNEATTEAHKNGRGGNLRKEQWLLRLLWSGHVMADVRVLARERDTEHRKALETEWIIRLAALGHPLLNQSPHIPIALLVSSLRSAQHFDLDRIPLFQVYSEEALWRRGQRADAA